jgi:AraC-like DNA-binding protein
MNAALAAAPTFDLLLRGAVGGLLLLHLGLLLLPGPRPAARAALAVFVVALIAYLFCQRAELMQLLPAPLAWAALALCVAGTGWLWLAARALFDDRFRFVSPWLAVPLALTVLGLADNGPRLAALLAAAPDPGAGRLELVHAAAMLGCIAAALWEVVRGWRDDLVEQRRALRRWAALGIGLYAAVALLVELAVRGRQVGLLLPALHVAGIGVLTMLLALLVARRTLGVVLGSAAAPDLAAPAAAAPMPVAPAVAPAPAAPPRPASPARARLDAAMREQRLYRREGLTLAALAQALGLAEAPLRRLINQELGYRNFNDFLHHHRLAEAAPRLQAEDLPILSIALDCGYGSIGPFNRAFRERFGMTPTEYRAAARMQRLQPAAAAPPQE